MFCLSVGYEEGGGGPGLRVQACFPRGVPGGLAEDKEQLSHLQAEDG